MYRWFSTQKWYPYCGQLTVQIISYPTGYSYTFLTIILLLKHSISKSVNQFICQGMQDTGPYAEEGYNLHLQLPVKTIVKTTNDST